MVVVGTWLACEDGEQRPMIRIEVESASGTLIQADFLVDLGADRSVFDAATLNQLQLRHQPPPPGFELQGVGGSSPFVVISTVLHLLQDDGGIAKVRGQFGAFTDASAIDFPILGRDVLNHFDVIVSRRRNQVLLLAGNHNYVITTS